MFKGSGPQHKKYMPIHRVIERIKWTLHYNLFFSKQSEGKQSEWKLEILNAAATVTVWLIRFHLRNQAVTALKRSIDIIGMGF